MISGRSLMTALLELVPTPSTISTDSMPTNCSAMYGMVARIPVTVTASPRPCEPYRPRANSATVT